MVGKMKGTKVKESLKRAVEQVYESLGMTEMSVFEGSILESLEKLAARIDAILQEANCEQKVVILKYDIEAEGEGITYRDLYDAGVKAAFMMGIYADREDIEMALEDGRVLNPEKECGAIDRETGEKIIRVSWKDGKIGAN